jgi:hypothetical protein
MRHRFGATRVLLIGADRALLFLSDRGALRHAYEFSTGEEGLRAFSQYLATAPRTPIRVLVDLMDEEFRLESIPHVRGRERRAVLERRQSRLFRGTPFWQALPQGRETEGRGDDRVLMMALTRPEQIEPWLAALARQHAPLAGIHSLPALAPTLLARLGIRGGHLMLVSVQAAGGLRQTFLRDGQITLSRLVAMPRAGTVPYGTFVFGEGVKLRRYLNSLALLGRDEPLYIHLLSHGESLRELEAQCINTETERHVLIDTATVATRLGLAEAAVTAESDVLFAQLLLDAPPSIDYARTSDRRDYRLHRQRLALVASAAAALLAGTGFAATRVLQAETLRQDTARLSSETQHYLERTQAARAALPATPIDAQTLRATVTIAKWLAARRGDPVPAWSMLGAVLAGHPDIRLERLGWHAGNAFNPAAQAEAARTAPTLELEGSFATRNPALPELTPRDVLARLEALRVALRAQSNVAEVEILRAPFDLDSASAMQGSTGDIGHAEPARFTLLIHLQPLSADGA